MIEGRGSATFGGLLRQLRRDAGLTQEELAELAGLSSRSVSDLERGINLTARKDTARLLADALGLIGVARDEFETIARGRVPVSGFAPGPAAPTRTLPRDIVSFTGREEELRKLAEAATARGAVVTIHAIGGMAGIGKTAFAVHAAHRFAPHFPDGQIFLPLHGHTPGQQPVGPADALGSLLLTAGVPAHRIPPGVEARMALWRDRMAGKQLLMVLDDAVDSEQVRPLLPGATGSLVLVTSRRHLTALEDATALNLDTLPPEEAVRLFIRLAGRQGLHAGDVAVGEIVRLCGSLPLAVGMLARKLHHHPAWTPTELAADVAAAHDRLELMASENLSVAAALDLSYGDLTEAQQGVFRRLGLHPGADIDAYALAALDDADLTAARRHLEVLYEHYLLTEPTRGRYRMHDLIREHARARAAGDPAVERDAAVARLLDYYLHTARIAERHLPRRIAVPQPGPAVPPPAHSPWLPTREEALAWLTAERVNLYAAADSAAANGRPGQAAAIAAAIFGFLQREGHWDQARVMYQAAAVAAGGDSDRLAEACALTDLGSFQGLIGNYPEATITFTRALHLFRDIGERVGQASALVSLGGAQRHACEYPAAIASLSQAAELYAELGEKLGAATAFDDLAIAYNLTGDRRAAAASLRQALELFREIGHQLGEATALDYQGVMQLMAGDHRAAAVSLAQALDLHRELGNRLGQANTLADLGQMHIMIGNYPAAAASLAQSLELCRELGYRLGEANALEHLAQAQHLAGDHRAATGNLMQALVLYRDIGNLIGEGNALNTLATVQQATGDYSTASASLSKALGLFRQIGNQLGQAEALNNMGELQLTHAAMIASARGNHGQALAIARTIAAPLEEARALEGIGQCCLMDDDSAAAKTYLQEAADIYQRIGSPHADRLRKTLNDRRFGNTGTDQK